MFCETFLNVHRTPDEKVARRTRPLISLAGRVRESFRACARMKFIPSRARDPRKFTGDEDFLDDTRFRFVVPRAREKSPFTTIRT